MKRETNWIRIRVAAANCFVLRFVLQRGGEEGGSLFERAGLIYLINDRIELNSPPSKMELSLIHKPGSRARWANAIN